MQPDIIALGEPMLEFSAEEKGELSQVNRFTLGWGGDTSNFIVSAARQGAKTGYITRLGADAFGDHFIKLWKKEGVDAGCVERDGSTHTGIYFISRDVKGHHFTYYRKGSAAALMTPELLRKGYISNAKLLHVSGISQAISSSACHTVFAAIDMARKAKVLVSYDSNLRLKLWPLDKAREVIKKTVALSDIFLPSLEDSITLTGLNDPHEIVAKYLSWGAKLVVLKLGAQGAMTASESAPPFQVSCLDPSGAGDAFDGAFVTAFLEGRSITECLRYANGAGALTTTGLGAIAPIPTRKEVEALINQD